MEEDNQTKNIALNEHTSIKEEVKKCMEYIAEVLRESPKKRERKCRLCDYQYNTNTLNDLFSYYGAAINCASNHTDSVEFDSFKVFYLEPFLLHYVDIEETYSVQKSLSKKPEPPSKEELLAEILVKDYALTAKEPKIKFFLRQEIESLLYVLYDTSNKVNMAMLLYMLFLRNETKRYFELLKEIDIKTLESYKLGLLLKMEEENHKEVDELYLKVKENFEDLAFRVKKYKSAIVLDPFTFFNEKEENEDIKKFLKIQNFYNKTKDLVPKGLDLEKMSLSSTNYVLEKPDLNEAKENIYGSKFYKKYLRTGIENEIKEFEDFDNWMQEQVKRLNWRDCISMWSSNRTFDSKLVDTAMIDVCSVNKKFIEGWDIYTNEYTEKNACLQCTANLCLQALEHTGNELWITRLSGIVKTVSHLKLEKECCEIASKSVPIICAISEEKRTCVMKTIIENSIDMAESDQVICFILETLLRIATKCKSVDTCQLCIEYANKFYDIWKKHRKGFFFTNRGKYDEDILCIMLCLCTETSNCDKFYQVCCDVKKFDPEIDYDTKIRLQKFHDQYHQNCKISTKELKNSKELIKHYVKYKK